MEFKDRVLTCIDCDQPFRFPAGEQLFFHDKQYVHTPRRCKACKAKKSSMMLDSALPGGAKVETRTQCFQCARETVVPFRPTQGRPVLCRSCYERSKPLPMRSVRNVVREQTFPG